MKEKRKRIAAGILAVCIALGIPANVQKAAAAGGSAALSVTQGRGRNDMENDAWRAIPIAEPETLSEDTSGGSQEASSEIVLELSESISVEESESISDENQETESEIISKESSQAESSSQESSDQKPLDQESENILPVIGEITESENTIQSSQKDAEMNNVDIVVEITDGGVFDYRTYMNDSRKPEVFIKLLSKKIYETNRSGQNENGTDAVQIPADERSGIGYQIIIADTDIVRAEQNIYQQLYGREESYTYDLSEGAAALLVNSVGKTDYEVRLLPNDHYKAEPVSGSIEVNNSPLYDGDFYIEVSGSNNKKYTFDEWKAYLEAHDQWVNGDIAVCLSEEGKRYYNNIKTMADMSDPAAQYSMENSKIKYVFWAENPDKNASTKDVENGTRSFTAAIDKSAPALTEFSVSAECYEPTRTDTEQYFGQDFVLDGRFEDSASGVERVEYTTDITLGEDAVWTKADITAAKGTDGLDFSVILQDGCYKAIAVRAYDRAGNVSATSGFVNEGGEYIKVVVDKSEPRVNISAASGSASYDGENDNWTNDDIAFDISLDKDSCPYAGIYQCQYAYEKIGEAVNNINMTGLSGKWTRLSLQDDMTTDLKIQEDRNGYYYFRVISKSGVMSGDTIKKRVLLQHKAPDIKPMIVNGVEDAKRKNGWYNKESGVPRIHFEYPEYDAGVTSNEYDAPVTIHYTLTVRTDDTDRPIQSEQNDSHNPAGAADVVKIEKSAVMGVMDSSDVTEDKDGITRFAVAKDDLDEHVIDFGFDAVSKEAHDGVYTLEYWITDKAGNASEKQTQIYKIDSHEPTDLTVMLEGSEFPVGSEPSIVYENFYQDNVSGNVSAQYGVSGKGALTVLKAKKIGEWKDMEGGNQDIINDNDVINIPPNTRCFLYVRAEDYAGNVAEGWTRGVVVDNMAPNQTNARELIIEPAGANEHGFFHDDVKVEITIQDAPEDDNCAALMAVTRTVGKDGSDTVTDEELFSFTKELPTEEELTAASSYKTVQIVDAKENEGNEAYIEVTAVDRSGNTKTSAQLLKIDVTKPQVDISFDNDNAVNGNFYNECRTATIHIQELNFDPSAVDVLVTKDKKAFDFGSLNWKSDGSGHYAAIRFSEDGEYTMEVSCTDLADNKSDTARTGTFTIDRTAPVVSISLDSKQDRQFHDNFFNTAVTAVITVTEHNFNENDFVMNVVPVSKKGVWNHQGDIHTMRLVFEGDNAYHIACAYTDLAGNSADSEHPGSSTEQDFVIDTVAPIIFIEGITDGSANRGAVLPVISVLDFNMEAQDTVIAVTTGVGDRVENTIETAAIDDGSGMGYRFSLIDMTDKEDNVYNLTVSACDKAGNESALTYRFSLNRKGSAYDLAQIMELMERQYITYSALADIQIVEMNIDTVEDFDIYISRNGELGYNAEYSKEVRGSIDTGYTYIYHVKRDNFAQEGTYRLSLYSRDRAGNEINNTTDIHGKEISFIVDNTTPKVVFDGIETGMVYDVETQEAHVCITDNFKLSEAEIILVDKADNVLGSWDYMELCEEGRQLDITIPQYNGELSLLYRVKDAAGNEVQTFQGGQAAPGSFLVTTDKFVQFINKPSKTSFGRTILFLMGSGIFASFAAILKRCVRGRKRCN